jgi:hypothetical protein
VQGTRVRSFNHRKTDYRCLNHLNPNQANNRVPCSERLSRNMLVGQISTQASSPRSRYRAVIIDLAVVLTYNFGVHSCFASPND